MNKSVTGKFRKRNIYIILTAFIIVFALVGLWCVISLSVPSEKSAERILKKDKELLDTVVTYVVNADRDISLLAYNYEASSNYNDIRDESVKKAIESLFNRGYISIATEDHSVFFLRWTKWRDFGAGLAYTLDENDEPQGYYLSKASPLSQKCWYYYEEN